MPRRFEHTVPSTLSAAAVHTALTSEKYWTDRIEAVGGPKATINEITISGDTPDTRTVVIDMTQAIAEEFLPGAITAIRPGDLVIHRTESWSSLDAQGASGTFEAKVEGAPATITGTLALRADGSTSTVTASGQAEVKVPIFGGKIEQGVIEQILALIDAEQEYTTTWAADNL